MASRTKIFFEVPEYTAVPIRSANGALKILRGLLKGYYQEPSSAYHMPRMPKWWWLQKNFEILWPITRLHGQLIITREKRGTRAGKSVYYQTLREKGFYPREREMAGNGRLATATGFRAVLGRGRNGPVIVGDAGRPRPPRPTTPEPMFHFDPFAGQVVPARQQAVQTGPNQWRIGNMNMVDG